MNWPPEHRDIVIRVDLTKGGVFITPECQLGAHWACPGGPCQCPAPNEECTCRQALNPSPGATASTAPPTPVDGQSQ